MMSDKQRRAIYFSEYRNGGGGSPEYHIPSHEKALRAVAEAAVKDAEQALCAVGGDEPVAWMHTMDNTEGLLENEPWTVFSVSKDHPFGRPGVDYSETFPVSSKPLYTTTPSAPVPDGYVLVPKVATRRIEDAIARSRNLKVTEIWEDALAASQPGVKS